MLLSVVAEALLYELLSPCQSFGNLVRVMVVMESRRRQSAYFEEVLHLQFISVACEDLVDPLKFFITNSSPQKSPRMHSL